MQGSVLDGLNDQQRQAVAHTRGPLLIVAGAGAGKTTVLTRRAARLIEEGVPPWKILIVTFTNKAARELRERLTSMVGEQGREVVAATFHSFALRHLLRRHGERIGWGKFSIIDDAESRALMKEAIEMLSQQERQQRMDEKWTPADFLAEMGLARAHGLSPDAYLRTIRPGSHDESFQRQVANAWKNYMALMEKNNVLDFDAILEKGVKILKEYEDVLHAMQNRFDYIMVDEYQDTNPIQADMIQRLAEKHHNLCVVGDAKQSIYRFRGSEVRIILDFQKTYPEGTLIELPVNYRSTGPIVDVANRLSDSMRMKVGKARMEAGGSLAELKNRPAFGEYPNGREEASAIAKMIGERIEAGVNPQDIAVLYRTRAVKSTLEEAMIAHKIPYVVVGDTSFFQRKEVRDLMAVIRVVLNPEDSLAWYRILDAAKLGISAPRVREEADMVGASALEVLQRKATGKGKIAGRIQTLLNDVSELRQHTEDGGAFQLAVNQFWESYLLESIRKAVKAQHRNASQEIMDKAIEARRSNAETLIDLVVREIGLQPFEEIVEDLMLLAADQNESSENAISLMTIHASKGLEFDHLFLAAVEDEMIPGSTVEPEEVEEERRILYVAMTRAKENLVVTCARQRIMFGRTVYCSPSRFLSAVSDQFEMVQEQPVTDENAAFDVEICF